MLIRYKIPYLNFNKTPAKIIGPLTRTSTCALGNYKWTKHIGNQLRMLNPLINHKTRGLNCKNYPNSSCISSTNC